ncbi:MAG TPA: DUF3060 domain-containing protein [Acidimicrobiia bacterium]|nr:DUF3060 domain-containing protein [Acidimicrobiia bacterium]
MKLNGSNPIVPLGLTLALLVGACGDGAEEPATTATATVVTLAPSTTATIPPPTSPPTTTPTTVAPSAAPSTTGTGSGEGITVGPGQELDHTTPDPATIQCDGGEIDIRVDDFDLTITGTCDDVDVYGSGGTLIIETTRELDIDGSGNTIEAEEVDEIDIDGDDNTLTVGSVREIDVEGNRNTVSFAGGNPEVDNEGQDNSIGPGADSA